MPPRGTVQATVPLNASISAARSSASAMPSAKCPPARRAQGPRRPGIGASPVENDAADAERRGASQDGANVCRILDAFEEQGVPGGPSWVRNDNLGSHALRRIAIDDGAEHAFAQHHRVCGQQCSDLGVGGPLFGHQHGHRPDSVLERGGDKMRPLDQRALLGAAIACIAGEPDPALHLGIVPGGQAGHRAQVRKPTNMSARSGV